MSLNGFNRPYIRDLSREFCPTYLPRENYSFYCNTDYNIDDISSGTWILRLIDINGNLFYEFGLLEILNITPSLINFYRSNIVFPIVPDGYYQFQIVTNSDERVEKCRSNVIISSSNNTYETTPIKFRHNDQLFGVRYDLLPNFYQMFRLPINQIRAPEYRSEREQYRESSNGRSLRTSKSFRDEVSILEMYFSNDEDLQALSAMNEHNEVYVSGNRLIQLNQIKVEKLDDRMNQSKATFEAIVNTYDVDTRRLSDYGDFILLGGNKYTKSAKFVQP